MPTVLRQRWSGLSKLELYAIGRARITRWCQLNRVPVPEFILEPPENWHWDACAYYRPQYIAICAEKCATICKPEPSRNWNWPGSTTDREPYGVLAHELGHHVDWLMSDRKGSYFGDYSEGLMASTLEKPITSYAPNPAEWFAEMFRLFVTNPSLLRNLRPKTYGALSKLFRSTISTSWLETLGEDVPCRVVKALVNKGA